MYGNNVLPASTARQSARPAFFSARSEMLGPLAVNQVPSTAFLRPDGILNAVVSGPKDQAWFERRIQEILP